MNQKNHLPAHVQIMQMATAKFVTRPLVLVAKLRIADLLAQGPKSAEELARSTGTHAPSLYRVLRALASVGVFSESAGQTFELTPSGELLKDEPGSLRAMVLMINDPLHDRAWQELEHSVQTGKPGFDKAFGAPIFEYVPKEAPEFAELFNRAMTSLATGNARAVAAGYDFSGIQKLVDVGGGHGALIMTILKANPMMTGMIYDLPSVIEGARKRLAEGGLASRCDAIGGDFFKSVPGADAIIMSHIIHDWNDDQAAQILKNCHEALTPGQKVLLVETIVPEGNQPSPAKLLDLEMLVMPGGRERTELEYDALLRGAGFKLARVVPLESGQSVLEGVRQ